MNLHLRLVRVSHFARHVRTQPFREPCRLVHDRTPVDDIDEPPRQAGAFGESDQPQRHHQRLPQAGRDVDDPRHVGIKQAAQQPHLPAKRRVPLAVFRSQLRECRGESMLIHRPGFAG